MKLRHLTLVASLVLLTALALPAVAKNGDSSTGTAYEDDHTTADAGDNAHPSGKDRSIENGGSGNQGKAESNPDDSKGPQRYEGAWGDDKPGGPGGVDTADQDGNNGCGNDDDFDDDNNGWCGNNAETSSRHSDDVLGEKIHLPGRSKLHPGTAGPAHGALGGQVQWPDDEVLGQIYRRAGGIAARPLARATRVLPFTGSSLVPFIFLGFALILGGWGLTRGAAVRS